MTNDYVGPTNSSVPTQYISDMQWSRIYALSYLDEMLRENGAISIGERTTKNKEENGEKYKIYKIYMSDVLTKLSCSGSALPGYCTKIFERTLRDLTPYVADIEYFCYEVNKTAYFIDPNVSFKEALEFNQLWACRNSIYYMCAILAYVESTSFEHEICEGDSVGVFKTFVNGLKNHGSVRTILLNMLFIKPIKIDDMPDCLAGYSVDLLNEMSTSSEGGTGNRAISLPSSPSCC